MVIEYTKNERWRRVIFVLIVAVSIAMAATAFFCLGFALRDFLAFEADKTIAQKHIDSLRITATDQEKVNANLSAEISQRRAVLDSQTELMDDYAVFTGKVALAKEEFRLTTDELGHLKKEVADLRGTSEAIKHEIVLLEKHRQNLNLEFVAKQNEASEFSDRLATLKQEKLAAESAIANLNDNLYALKSRQNEEMSFLSALTNKITEAQNKINTLENNINKNTTTFNEILNLAHDEALKLKDERATLASTQQSITKLKAEIAALTKQKAEASELLEVFFSVFSVFSVFTAVDFSDLPVMIFSAGFSTAFGVSTAFSEVGSGVFNSSGI